MVCDTAVSCQMGHKRVLHRGEMIPLFADELPNGLHASQECCTLQESSCDSWLAPNIDALMQILDAPLGRPLYCCLR